MLICGIWHGAAWHFALWGLWHGIGIAIYQMWQRYRRRRKLPAVKNPPWINRFPATVLNFSFVTLGWLFFHNDASAMASGLLDPLAWLFIPLVAAGILLVLRGFQWFAELTLSPGWRAVYALILSLMFYYGMNTGFIYGKF